MSILIVDDDDYQRNLLSKMLTAIGIIDIKQAASAAVALELAVALRDGLHVIISDLDMPDVDGMEFLRLLSEQKTGAAVLVVSGKHESILRSVGLMATEYGLTLLGTISKPAKIPALREILSAYLQRPKARSRGPAGAVSAEEVLQGLELRQFEPFFQPKVELETRRLCGAEALVRWRHPERGILPPGLFIGVAERHDLIDRLTWVVLEKSMAQVRQWITAGIDIPVSVNFSQANLADTRLSNMVNDVLFRHGLKPEYLIVEVTETLAMTELAQSLETLSRMRMKGFGLSIDDFGTGHSSLQQLARVPYTELKIDQAFVMDAAKQSHLRAVVESSITMAKKLGLKSVGEGIETPEDWACLQQLGCEIGQGYHIAKPMEGERLIEWSREYR